MESDLGLCKAATFDVEVVDGKYVPVQKGDFCMNPAVTIANAAGVPVPLCEEHRGSKWLIESATCV